MVIWILHVLPPHRGFGSFIGRLGIYSLFVGKIPTKRRKCGYTERIGTATMPLIHPLFIFLHIKAPCIMNRPQKLDQTSNDWKVGLLQSAFYSRIYFNLYKLSDHQCNKW